MASGKSAAESFDQVLGAAREGEEWAFSRLYRRFNPRLLRYFAARAPRDAEDLASETWLGVARKLVTFDGNEQAFNGWLFTIAHRQLVQHWRGQARRPTTAQADISDAASGVDVQNEVLDAVGATQAARVIAGVLTPDQTDVLLLRIFGGLGVPEVAKVLGKRPGTVRTLQHKALRRLAPLSFFNERVNAMRLERD